MSALLVYLLNKRIVCPGGAGKYSVPVLWDKKEKTIVNNESSDILRMFNAGGWGCQCP